MATRKNLNVAAACGGGQSGDFLQQLLADPRYTITAIAGIMGTTPLRLTQLLAEPAPFPLLPLNWTSSPGPGVYVPYVGVVPITYAGPSTPGYTYGAPIASREDFS